MLENETSNGPDPGRRTANAIDLGDGWVGEWEDGVDEPPGGEPHPVLAAAQRYVAHGWAPIPVPRGKKGPILAGWPNLRLTEADLPAYFGGDCNIGVLNGEPSGGLTDVDLDAPEALAVADAFLPETGTIFGRASKRRSHRIYVVSGTVPDTARFQDPTDGATLVELRSTGSQTVWPPSAHPSGEAINFDAEGEPAQVDGAELRTAVARVAACTLLARHWPKVNGSRHHIALAVAGYLLHSGLDEASVKKIILHAARVAGDEEVEDRIAAVMSTAQKIASGEKTTGGPTLVDLLGEKIARRLRDWLGLHLQTAEQEGIQDDDGASSGILADQHATDLGNARRLVQLHGHELRYCAQLGTWFVWDGRRWARDETAEVMRRAKATIRQLYRQAASIQDEERRQKVVKHALVSEAEARLSSMVRLAESELGIQVTATELDADPWAFNVLNGTLDLQTGALRPHRREDLITKLAPVEYHPDATSALWQMFLDDATGGDRDLQAFLQRAAGYSLTGDTSEERLFFPYGPPASGKTTFIEALKAAMGEYAMTADFETFIKRRDGGPRNDLARLAGMRFVSSVEVDEGKQLAEGIVKQVTGGDRIVARFLYREAFEYRPQFKLWLAANHAPRVSDVDEAIWRRILRVPFEHTVPEEKRDPKVKAALTDTACSGSAILAWLVQGCLAWQRQRLGVPASVKRSTEAYREEVNRVLDFIEDRCVVEEGARQPFSDLYSAYQNWCKDMGERPLSHRAFGERLTAQGFSAAKSNGQRVRIGILIRVGSY